MTQVDSRLFVGQSDEHVIGELFDAQLIDLPKISGNVPRPASIAELGSRRRPPLFQLDGDGQKVPRPR